MTSRNIVICCDGTGNEYGTKNTNVVEIFKMLKLENPVDQVAFYDPGVGTMGDPSLHTGLGKTINKGLGLAFGRGMTRIIHDAYRYAMNSYRDGDRLFLFGFSRGAYTVRALAGMVHKIGLLKKGSENLIPYATRLYKEHPENPEQWRVVNGFKKTFSKKCQIHFLGVWDTVKSVGLCRRSVTLDYTLNNPGLLHGRHAVSLDERRSHYQTNLWGYKNGSDFQEVWFPGVHSDVGGSYEACGLAQISLKWMARAAEQYGLLLDKAKMEKIQPDPLGLIHNPLKPYWWALGWKRREVRHLNAEPDAGTWIHSSVKARMEAVNSYKPSIPQDSIFVD